MESNIAGALKISAGLSATGVVCGFASWAWLPEHIDFFGVGEVPKLVGILLVPVIGIVLTLMVALIVSCDPLIATQDLSSRAAVAAMIAVPSFFSLPIQIILLWATWSDHKVGTTPFTVLASILLIILGFVFNYVEQNHVVGIRDLWTLQSAHVWEETHALASKMFAITGVVGIVLAFFVPGGFWQEMLIIALFLIPSIAAVIYSFIIREDAQYQYIVR
jgi:uncharacterized membrane protein